MADGFFRSKQGYTVVQNAVTRDKNISLKAKGLYLVIQSNITMPDKKWLKSEFLNMVPEGKAAFDSAWNELKNNGYLHVHTYSNGKSFTYEYELLNEPVEGPHTFYYNSKGELSSTNLDRAAKKNDSKKEDSDGVTLEETQENQGVRLYTDFRCIGNQAIGNQVNGNQCNGDHDTGNRANGNWGNNNNPLNINPNNNYFNVNTSIKSYPSSETHSSRKSQMGSDGMDDCDVYMQIIKENVNYDELMRYRDHEVRERYDELYQLICDVVCVPRKTVRVNGQDYPYQLVKSQFLKLKQEHLQYVAECLKDNYTEVGNIRAYLITALYNAPSTLKNHEAQDFRTETHSEYKSEFDYEHERRMKLSSELRDQGVPLGERIKIFEAPYPGEES